MEAFCSLFVAGVVNILLASPTWEHALGTCCRRSFALHCCDPFSETLVLPLVFSKEKVSTYLQLHIIIFYDNLMLMQTPN